MKKKCVVCGGPITAKYRKKTCGEECAAEARLDKARARRDAARQVRIAACTVCGGEYEPRAPNQKVCSQECRWAALREKAKARKAAA